MYTGNPPPLPPPFALAVFFISPRMTVLNLSLWLLLIRNSRKKSEFLRCFHLPLFFHQQPHPAICPPPLTRYSTPGVDVHPFPSRDVLFGYLFVFSFWLFRPIGQRAAVNQIDLLTGSLPPFFFFYRVCRRIQQLTHINAQLLCSPLICAWAWASGPADSQGRLCLHSNNYFVSAWANHSWRCVSLLFLFTRRCV